MKLISLNVEGNKHPSTVWPFLKTEQAEVLCLQEAPEDWCVELEVLGYHTTFAPMMIRSRTETYVEGVIFASKLPHSAVTEYYHKSREEITEYLKGGNREEIAHPVIIGSVELNGEAFTVATTHLMVTKDGQTDDHQRQGIKKLLAILSNQEPHVLCGDFNMPRGVNELYQTVTKHYTDTIPAIYKSSLDRTIHRLGSREPLNRPIFDTFMVDYIFTQSPYTATDVSLRFNVSDHTAVIGTIFRKE